MKHLPSPETLGATALEDVYQDVRSAVKAKLSEVNSICLTFDSWTDRYKARPYLGVRASFLDECLENSLSHNVFTETKETATVISGRPLTGAETDHLVVRDRVVRHMESDAIGANLYDYLNENVTDYLSSCKMGEKLT